MSFNFSDASPLPPHLSSSNSSLYAGSAVCFTYRSSFFIFTAFSVTNILLLLPLCLLVLYLGLQLRWQERSKAASHSDIFTYHMVATEMFGTFGCGLYCCGASIEAPRLMMVGVYFFTISKNGQIPFHILTCVERHLAVVHPITYLGLRERGVRIRNVIIGCVWLLFFALFGLILLPSNSIIPYLCVSVLSIAVVSFCSVSVLRALMRPGPGFRERVDRSKMRAFNTIMAIMGALLLSFGGHVLVLSIHASLAVSERVRCEVLMSGAWFSLPSTLVLPLLFLNRAGKLLCCRSNTESE